MNTLSRRSFISTAAVAPIAAPVLAKPESEIIRLYREYVELEAIDTGVLSQDAIDKWCKKSSSVQQSILELDVLDEADFAAKIDVFVHTDLEMSKHEIQRLKSDAKSFLGHLT